ncbi:MAG: efflux RND transporter permease subunit [bacterium]
MSSLGVRRPVAVSVVVVVVAVLGYISMSRLGVDLMPDIQFPVISVITAYEGVAPEEIENQVTRHVEDVVGSAENVKNMYSSSQEGLSIVTAEFEWGVDVDTAAEDVRDGLEFMKRFLPVDAEKPMVVKFDPAMFPVVMISFFGREDELSLRDYVEDVVMPRIERVESVAASYIFGGMEREILVEVDAGKLDAHEIPIMQVVRTIGMENLDVTGGRVDRGYREYLVRSKGEFERVKEIGKVALMTRSGRPVYLEDVAAVKDTSVETRHHSRMNRRPAIMMGAIKETGSNTVKVVNGVRDVLEKLRGELPPDVDFRLAFDQSEYVKQSVTNVQGNLLSGAVLAVIVVLVFLGSFRGTLIVGFAIPVSVIAAMIPIYFQGFTLNNVSLGGLAIAVGMLVDNSIVVLENVFRHMQGGKDPYAAGEEGTAEVASAISASTLTTVVVFMPIAYIGGMAAKIFSQLAWTVTYSLAASLAVAVVLVPMMTCRLIRIGESAGERKSLLLRVRGRYERVLAWAIRHRWTVVGASFAMLLISLAFTAGMGKELMGEANAGEFIIEFDLPKGTRLGETDRITRKFEDAIMPLEFVESVGSRVGVPEESAGFGAAFGGRDEGPHTSSIMVKLKPLEERGGVSTPEAMRIVGDMIESEPGLNRRVRTMMNFMAHMGSGLEIDIFGDDLNALRELSNRIAGRIRDVEGLQELNLSITEGRPELLIRYDRDKLSSHGLNVAEAAHVVRAAMKGQVASLYREGDDEYDVRVRYRPDDRDTVEDIRNIALHTPMGARIRLRDVADIGFTTGPTKLERKNRHRLAKITGDISGRPLGDVVEEIKARLSDVTAPEGYSIEFGGQYEQMQDVFASLTFALLLAVFLVYMVMAAQFESLLHPFVIMFTVPLAFIGVIPGLFITGIPLSLMSFLGIIMLVGVVVNNGIVMVDFINQLKRGGMERTAAVVVGASVRFRPVIMTALTTIFGMLPLALGLGGEGAEMRQPMGVAFISGMVTATALTLVVVPVVYSLLDPFGERVQAFGRRILFGRRSGRV